jgi:excisionase family DNA binding protein
MSTNIECQTIACALPRLALNVKETAAVLGVSVPSVRRLIERGLLKPNRALRVLRISAAEIERFLAQ